MNRHAIPDIDLRTVLSARDLECHLLVGGCDPAFPPLLCAELKPLIESAYGRPGQLTAEHFQYETWGVTLRRISDGAIVACCTLGFRSSLPSYFCVRFEAVEPSLQRTGLGRLLFECATVWTRFLLLNDVLVLEGVMRAGGSYCLVAYIDAPDQDEWAGAQDNAQTHGAFLKRLGFVRAQHDFDQTEDEIAFQREFHVPLGDRFEEEGALPPRPATA